MELGNRTNGGTCVMAQALTSTSRTGEALQQYELDTNQSVMFDTYHLGKDHYNIHTAIDDRDPLDISLSADQHLKLPDGAFVYSKYGNLITTTNNVLEISGIPNVNSDFALVKTFSADETLAMKGKDINVTMNISNPTVGVDLYLAIWEGAPNEYTYDFIKGRNQNGSPMTAANWVIKDILYHDSKPDNAYYNINKTFTIPRGVSDTNYAIVIVPSSEVYSDSIKIKDLQVDVAEPFNTYYIHGIKDKNESHLIYDPGYVRFWLANIYYASFRYTMDSKETPYPCGYVIRGKGPVVQDQTYNMVPGSVNNKGEGGMKFLEEGIANLNTELLLWSEKDHNTTATFWWAKVMPDGTFSEIPETRTVFNVESGWKQVQCKMKEANVKVAADEILVLRGMSSELDGAFLESTDKSNPLVITDVIFTGLVSSSLYDDPELISSPMDAKLQVDRRVFEFSNNQSPNIVIDLNIEDGVELANYSAVHISNNKVIPLTNAEFSYDSVLKKLTVHVGNNVTEGKIYLEFWG